jgi:hypothetical protein
MTSHLTLLRYVKNDIVLRSIFVGPKILTLYQILGIVVISNGKVVKYKVVGLITVYNFCFGHFSI